VREERRLRVFENTVLRRIFGPKRGKVTGEWRTPRNEELYDLYLSLTIVRVIKSRRMRRDGACSSEGGGGGVYRVLVGKPEGKNHWGDPGIDGGIIIPWIFKKQDVGVWTGLSSLKLVAHTQF
jgi:hypothetical protein